MTDHSYPAPPPPVPVPGWPVATTPPPSLARRIRLLLGASLALVVLGAGAAASMLLLEEDRGAESPRAAAEQLLEAINEADALGVIDLLPDGERRLLLDITDELTSEGDRLGVLGDDFRLDGFPGLTLEVSQPELEVTELAEGLAVVTLVDGVASYELDGSGLTGSLGSVVDAVAEANDVDVHADDQSGEIDADEFRGGPTPFMVAVIEENGRWFPSVAFTIAESARVGLASGDAPDLDDGVEPDGARDPIDAVQDLVDAGTSADLEAALEIVDPGELGALQVYAETLFGELAAGEETGIAVEITDADVQSLGGGVNRVIPTGLVAEVDFGADLLVLTIDGECVSVLSESSDDDVDDLDVEICNDDLSAAPGELGEGFDDLEVPDELTDLIEAFEPVEIGIITVERDGEHYISPVRTLFDISAVAFRGLEPGDLADGGIVFEALTGELDDEFGDFFDELGVRFDEQFDEFEEEFPAPGDGESDEDDTSDVPLRVATGASGPNGELLVGDVAADELQPGGVATFTVIGVAGEGYIGAQAIEGADLTITVYDAATGDELDFSDDFVGHDPEAFVVLTEGQVLTVEVAGYGDEDAGGFVVYYET